MVLNQELHFGDDLRVNEPAEGGAQEAQVGRRIVQHARKQAAAPIEQRRAGLAQLAGVALQPIQRRHHRREDADEQNGHLLDRMKVKLVRLVDFLPRGEPGTDRRARHQGLARERRAAQEHRTQDDRQPGDIPQTVESPLLAGFRRAGPGRPGALAGNWPRRGRRTAPAGSPPPPPTSASNAPPPTKTECPSGNPGTAAGRPPASGSRPRSRR